MTTSVARHAGLFSLLAGLTFAGPAMAGGCYSVDCYRQVQTPPVFDTVSEQRLVRAPRTIYRSTPGAYSTVTERVMVSPAGRVWQQSYNAHGQLVGCWVTTPPRYALQARRVMIRPPEMVPVTVPPVYANFNRRVLVQPAGSAWVPASAPPVGIGSIPDAMGITGASSADIGVGLGFSSGSIYDGYAY